MIFDLTRHKGLISLGLRMIEDSEFLKLVFSGDKDIFRFMFLLTRQPFYFVPELVRLTFIDKTEEADERPR